jgi:carboxyl-terminal processing protease
MRLFGFAIGGPEDPGRSRGLLSKITLFLAVGLVAGGGFYFGFLEGQKQPKHIVIEGIANMDNPASVSADFSTFWQAWKVVEENYLKQPEVDSQTKVYGAIRGLLGSLRDPHSEYFPPRDNQKFQEDIQGNFGGIGAELGVRQGSVVVIAPLKNTPAEAAGLRAGDRILLVNASSTEGVSLDEVVGWIRGPKGTDVTLTIFRDEWDNTREVKITRATISIPTLDFEMRGDVGYIQLYSFNAQAEQLFYQAALDMLSRKAKGLVLDLRNNPGGYLEVAVNLTGWFVPRDTLVVSEANRDGTTEEFRARGNEAFADFPVVLLINRGSASASEILAGALRDIRQVPLVGQTSFGKGTVQQLFPLTDDSSVKLTIAHWVLPSGHVLEGKGLEPDYEVELTEEDAESKRDPQLDKALEVVRGLIR